MKEQVFCEFPSDLFINVDEIQSVASQHFLVVVKEIKADKIVKVVIVIVNAEMTSILFRGIRIFEFFLIMFRGIRISEVFVILFRGMRISECLSGIP